MVRRAVDRYLRNGNELAARVEQLMEALQSLSNTRIFRIRPNRSLRRMEYEKVENIKQLADIEVFADGRTRGRAAAGVGKYQNLTWGGTGTKRSEKAINKPADSKADEQKATKSPRVKRRRTGDKASSSNEAKSSIGGGQTTVPPADTTIDLKYTVPNREERLGTAVTTPGGSDDSSGQNSSEAMAVDAGPTALTFGTLIATATTAAKPTAGRVKTRSEKAATTRRKVAVAQENVQRHQQKRVASKSPTANRRYKPVVVNRTVFGDISNTA